MVGVFDGREAKLFASAPHGNTNDVALKAILLLPRASRFELFIVGQTGSLLGGCPVGDKQLFICVDRVLKAILVPIRS